MGFAGTDRRGFTGHEHLDDLGLIHMNGRVYDPAIGRFISADPVAAGIATSQTLNRYTYVGNNPLSFTDPNGHNPLGLFIGIFLQQTVLQGVHVIIQGVVIGGLQTAISGGDWSDIVKGAVLGGLGGGITDKIGRF